MSLPHTPDFFIRRLHAAFRRLHARPDAVFPDTVHKTSSFADLFEHTWSGGKESTFFFKAWEIRYPLKALEKTSRMAVQLFGEGTP